MQEISSYTMIRTSLHIMIGLVRSYSTAYVRYTLKSAMLNVSILFYFTFL